MKQLNDQYFTYRQTPVDYDGVARPSIKGNTLCWNQLVQNGNFASTSNWAGERGTISASNNVLTYTITNTNTGASGNNGNRIYQTLGKTIPVDNKVLVLAQVNVPHACDGVIQYRNSLGQQAGNIVVPLKSGWNDINVFLKPTDVASVFWLCVDVRTGYEVGETIQFKNVMLVDLTAMFGSGNEPTIDQFKTLFPLNYYAYNSGSLLNFNGTGIKTTGKNLINYDVWKTVTTYNGTSVFENNGVTITATGADAFTQYNNANFPVEARIPVTNGKTITLSWECDEDVQAIAYIFPNGSTAGLVSLDQRFGDSLSYTPTTGVQYVSFRFGVSFQGETVHFKNIMMRFADTDSTFEPYTSSTLSLPISTYFPTGMKSAGTIYDELSDKAITRVGSVDLGSLTWVYQSGGQGRFECTGIRSLVKKPLASSVIANIKCAKYQNASVDNIYTGTVAIGIHTNGDIWVHDSTYGTDADAFKSAMSGVYLNYELATYTEQDVDPIYYDFYGNGTEQLLPVNTDTPSTSPLLADIIYYNLTDSEVPYRVFWAINSKLERWDFTEREFKSFMNNPQGLGFSKTISVNRYGNVQNLTDITDNFPQPNGEVLFYDSSNSTRYDKYNQFVKFLSYEPITLYYKIPVSFYSRIPNTYSLECVVGTLTKTESKTDHMLTCSINYNALSFYKGEEVEISGTGTSYTINNDSDFPIGFEITITGTPVNPYFTLTQDGEMYGEAKFTDSTAFSSVYVNSNDGEQNVELQQGGSVLPNPLSYQDLSISNGSIYVTFVKLARGESTLTIGKDSGSIAGVDIVFTPIYRSV